MPLEVRRKHLIANYWVNLQGHNDLHPTKEVLKESWRKVRSRKDNFGHIGNKTAKELQGSRFFIICHIHNHTGYNQ